MTAPNPREVAELANEIMKTEDHLNGLKKRWSDLFNLPLAEESASEPKKAVGRPPRDGSPSSVILPIISSNPHTEFTAELLHRRTGIDREHLSNTLHNLYKAKKIQRIGRGVYGALNYSVHPLDTIFSDSPEEAQIQ